MIVLNFYLFSSTLILWAYLVNYDMLMLIVWFYVDRLLFKSKVRLHYHLERSMSVNMMVTLNIYTFQIKGRRYPRYGLNMQNM